MKKFIYIIIFVLLLVVLSIFSSCTEESNTNENETDFIQQSEEYEHDEGLLPGIRANNIEELENILMFSRELQKYINNKSLQENILTDSTIRELQSLYNVFEIDISTVLISNSAEINSYLIPNFEFDEFEMFSVSGAACDGTYVVNYRYKSTNSDYNTLDYTFFNGINIRFENLRPEGAEIADLLGPIAEQLTRDGFVFQRTRYGYNDFWMQIDNTNIRMHVRFAEHLGGYEFIRDIALREFTPANIMSVDEMIERRFGGGEIADHGEEENVEGRIEE